MLSFNRIHILQNSLKYYLVFINNKLFNNFFYFKFMLLIVIFSTKVYLFLMQLKVLYEKILGVTYKINCYMQPPGLKLSILLNFKKFDWNLLKIIDRGFLFKRNFLSKYSAVIKKKTFVDYFYQNRFLIGYKLRFAGRFKRRRKRVIMWLKKGLTPITAHEKWIDYGFYEISNEHSQYSVRIWLNKNKNIKYKHYLKF